jgi:hypothetical protein
MTISLLFESRFNRYNQRMTDSAPSERKAIFAPYYTLIASIVCGFVPNAWFALISLILFTAVFFQAGRARKNSAPDSLTAHHMTYLLRTLWVFTAITAVTVAAASAYVLKFYDPSALMPCVQKAMGDGATDAFAVDSALGPCMADFMTRNMKVFIAAALIAAVPALIYLLYRMARGLSFARRDARLPNVGSWV